MFGYTAKPVLQSTTLPKHDNYIYYIYTYLETPLATIFAGGQMLWMLWILRRKLVKSPDFCKNAGEIQKCRICRCINVLKQQNTEEKNTENYAGIMGN